MFHSIDIYRAEESSMMGEVSYKDVIEAQTQSDGSVILENRRAVWSEDELQDFIQGHRIENVPTDTRLRDGARR
jgi:hypothetical protein